MVAFSYALIVLLYVQAMPDIGIRSAFSTAIMGQARPIAGDVPHEGDEITRVGDIPIIFWPDLLNAPFYLRERLHETEVLPSWAKSFEVGGEDVTAVRVHFKRPDGGKEFESWFVLGKLPWEDLAPSILWFVFKVMLFSVGALVLWKRPTDDAATQFFFLCVVTLGAFMGGYHWSHIATQPPLLMVFMVCAVLLPVVSLHFYLLFPKKKRGWKRTRG